MTHVGHRRPISDHSLVLDNACACAWAVRATATVDSSSAFRPTIMTHVGHRRPSLPTRSSSMRRWRARELYVQPRLLARPR